MEGRLHSVQGNQVTVSCTILVSIQVQPPSQHVYPKQVTTIQSLFCSYKMTSAALRAAYNNNLWDIARAQLKKKKSLMMLIMIPAAWKCIFISRNITIALTYLNLSR